MVGMKSFLSSGQGIPVSFQMQPRALVHPVYRLRRMRRLPAPSADRLFSTFWQFSAILMCSLETGGSSRSPVSYGFLDDFAFENEWVAGSSSNPVCEVPPPRILRLLSPEEGIADRQTPDSPIDKFPVIFLVCHLRQEFRTEFAARSSGRSLIFFDYGYVLYINMPPGFRQGQISQ